MSLKIAFGIIGCAAAMYASLIIGLVIWWQNSQLTGMQIIQNNASLCFLFFVSRWGFHKLTSVYQKEIIHRVSTRLKNTLDIVTKKEQTNEEPEG